MPYRSRKRKRQVSRRRRRRRYAPRRWARRRVVPALPKYLTLKSKYSSIITMDPGTSGVPASHTFRANSIDDPDQTGVGHQPMYYDELRQLYSCAEVLWSKIQVMFVNNSSTEQYQAYIFTRCEATSAHTANRNDFMETSGVRKAIIGARDSSRGVVKMSKSARIKSLAGKEYDRSSYTVNYADGETLPKTQWNYVVKVEPFTGSADLSAVPCKILLTYITRWSLPKLQAVAGS